MKNSIYLAVLGLFLASCSNEEIQINTGSECSTTINVSTVKVVDGKILPISRSDADQSNNALSFADEESYSNFKLKLDGMTFVEKTYLMSSLGVQTLHDLAVDADEELEQIGESATSEDDFKQKYSEYVNRYSGLLISNYLDSTDLNLYVPNEDKTDSFIGNSKGLFVVNNEIRMVDLGSQLSDEVVDNTLKILSLSAAKANATNVNSNVHQNSYVVYPKSGKRVSFSIARKYDTIIVSMDVAKKMWYGWKNDPNRVMIFEPHFTSATVKWIEPFYTRYWMSSKTKYQKNLFTITNGAKLGGTIYTWTDMTAEHDSNDDLIIEKVGNTTAPKCSIDKSEIVNVDL